MSFRLGTTIHPITGKAAFTLNDKAFYPICYSIGYGDLTSVMLDGLLEQGFNALILVMDCEDFDSLEVRNALEMSQARDIPVIVEVNEWSFWACLKDHLDLNMVMANGEPVRYFPDYANRRAKAAHLERYRKCARFLNEFAHRPIVAVSVGAYDSYHLPDGEVHVDFTVPHADRKYQTMLPYGTHVEEAFADYLNQRVHAKSDIVDLKKRQSPPHSVDDAVDREHWKQWVLFRRFLVKKWLADTLNVVREETGLPVTVTFDINFSLVERFASPPFDWEDILDFVIVYYYGRSSNGDYIEPLLRAVYKSYNDAELPMISLLEFSSALGGNVSGDVYAMRSAPFVSGLATAPPHGNPDLRHTPARVDAFTRWVGAHRSELDEIQPEQAHVLILVDREAIFFENPFAPVLSNLGIPYDIQYVGAKDFDIPLGDYEHILLPSQTSPEIMERVRTDGRVIFENDESYWLDRIQKDSAGTFEMDSWVPGIPVFEDDFQSLDTASWAVTLSREFWKIENGWLSISKTGQNEKGLGTLQSFSPPYLIIMRIACQNGMRWRISLLDAAGYPLKGEAPGSGVGEVSWGIDPLSEREGEFGILLDSWIPIARLALEIPYDVEVWLLPKDDDQDLLDLRVFRDEQGSQVPECKFTLAITKRRTDRLWLLWAYPESAARIDSVRIVQLMKKETKHP